MSPCYHSRMVPFDFTLRDHHYLPETSRNRPRISPEKELEELICSSKFHTIALCKAVSNGCDLESVKAYIERYRDDPEEFPVMMGLATPCLCYAIGKNSPKMVTLLVEYGIGACGTLDGEQKSDMVPPLAFAVIHGHTDSVDTTEIVKILLAAEPLGKRQHIDLKGKVWCRTTTLDLLAQGLKVSQRYYLQQASIHKPLTIRETQLAEVHDAMELLKLPYRIVGQLPILMKLQQTVLDHLDSPSSLVMVFAGPPGYGKTELAQELGDLLNLKTMAIACSQMKHDTELFGSKQGYERSSEGSLPNNHLAKNNGRFNVAFLAEFDKTSPDVCVALLTVMSEGANIDRRNNRTIDCSKTLWILASNCGDEAIKEFYHRVLEHMKDGEKLKVDLSGLQRDLRGLFKGHWGGPLTSRIDHIFPFFPFSHGEQAVVAHKFLLNDAAQVRKDINLSKDVPQHVGHCIVTHYEDWKLCGHMAIQGYDEDSRAQSLTREARKVAAKTRIVYNSVPEPVTQSLNEGPYEALEVKLISLGDQQYDVHASRKIYD
ncbi:hypothetical protein NX059_004223 [Plenodomus lindquistii]|nr:hypothetical protein NX059_004223 [Plenodomus lindquistii]